MSLFASEVERIDHVESRRITGTVDALRGLTLLARDLPLPVGSLVSIGGRAGMAPVLGEVTGFETDRTILMLLGEADGIRAGSPVVSQRLSPIIPVGTGLLGRVIDALGRPIDGGGPLREMRPRALRAPASSAMRRRRITAPMPTGVRVIDAMLTLGCGQRIGIFAGPGVGKSTLLASIARNTAASVNVIALIGERGREVRDFIEDALGPEGLARSVVIVATSDESPLLRVRAATAGCAVAEYFRDRGQDVMLMMDSVTRFAQAQRQIGLASGEPPATRGYTPSVFAQLPRLLERAGAIEGAGSITGIYTVLVEGDDMTEPVADAARGVLDGHIVLSRRLAARGHFPAVDVLDSVSRVADEVSESTQIEARRFLRRLLAAYAESEELIGIGAYAPGSNPDCDTAIRLREEIDRVLRQESGERATFPESCRALNDLFLRSARVREQLRRGEPVRSG